MNLTKMTSDYDKYFSRSLYKFCTPVYKFESKSQYIHKVKLSNNLSTAKNEKSEFDWKSRRCYVAP